MSYSTTGGAGLHETVVEPTATLTGAHVHRRISWAAIFGGVIMIVVVQLLLTMLGAGIGLSALDVGNPDSPSAGSFGIGAGIWWVASTIVALFVGGYVAAWMAGVETRFDGILHGAIAWGISTLVTLWLLSSAVGGIIGGGYYALKGAAGAAGSGLKDVAQPLVQSAGITPDAVTQQAKQFLQPTTPDPAAMSPEDATKEIGRNLVTYARGGAEAQGARERIVDIMAAQLKIPRDEAARRFDATSQRVQQKTNQAVQTAKSAANEGAEAISKASFAAFGNLLLGAIAAAIGGSLAVQRRLLVPRDVAR